MFVIRTKDGQYVGPLGFTPRIDKAAKFSSRMGALGECQRMGAVLDHAAIVPYSPEERPPQEAAENLGTGSK